MSLAVHMTPEMYAAYNVPVDPRFSYSAEDWLQRQARAMNERLAKAIYPATPQGSALRVRLNTIGVSPDGPPDDGEHDGRWLVRDDVRCPDCGYYDPAEDIDWGLVHELSHQVSIIDLYAIGVYAANVFVLGQDGNPANMGFGWMGGGLMGGGDISPYSEPNLYSSHTAAGSSTYAGYRNGYYGSYLFDIPEQNILRVLDNQGSPAEGVQVDLYQRAGPWDWTGQMGVDETPEISGSTDGDGLFILPNRSANGGTVTANGHVQYDNPFGVVDIIGNQGLFLIRLARDGHEEFQWLDITQFNLAYWLGDTTSHTFTVHSHVPPAGAPGAPKLLAVRAEGEWASLDWAASSTPGVSGYRVYRAAHPQYHYVAVGELLPTTHFEESFWPEWDDGQHRLYAITAVGSDGLESGFGAVSYAPGLGEPVAVAVAPDGSRTILNNWNLYPLLRQQADGRYTHRLVNVHYDLGSARHMSYDGAGRLLVSGFGLFPEERRPAVRIYGSEFEPLWAFGEEEVVPGQFIAPAGIAVWKPSCSLEGPYNPDSHTLLLLHFDGHVRGAGGEEGTATGISFEPGRFGQGVLIDEEDTLIYSTEGNVQRQAGTVEMWVLPNEPSQAMPGVHTLFETEDPADQGGIQVAMGDGNLGAIIWTREHVAAIGTAVDWRAGEWHHVAVSWQEHEMWLAVDGWLVDHSDEVVLPPALGPLFRVGSTPNLGWQANAVLDELRISDIRRPTLCGGPQRLLVVDSGKHSVMAFDDQGSLLAEFGSHGAGPGEFDGPEGLAVDPSGRLIVADRGNNRLVALSFDGQDFGYMDSYQAGLDAPCTVAADGSGRLFIADTGNDRVVVLAADGAFLVEFLVPNDGSQDRFLAPRGVAVDPRGDVIVADAGNRRVVTVRTPWCSERFFLPLVSN